MKARLRDVGMYLGCAPFIRFADGDHSSPSRRLHHEAALGSFFILVCVTIAFIVAFVLLSVLMIWARPVYEGWKLEPYVLDALWKSFLAWGVIHLFCLGHALAGSQHPLPLVSRLGAHTVVRRTVKVFAWSLILIGASVSLLAFQASRLTPVSDAPGKVYFVYEDNGLLPRWLFSLALYRVASTSRDVYGTNEVRLLRINRENLRLAFSHGVFVIVGSHGQAQGIIADKGWFSPGDLRPGDVGHQLDFVYLTGCDSGAQADAWARALKPAKVVTHDRLTAVLEHAWWLWFEAPRELRKSIESIHRRYELSPGAQPMLQPR